MLRRSTKHKRMNTQSNIGIEKFVWKNGAYVRQPGQFNCSFICRRGQAERMLDSLRLSLCIMHEGHNPSQPSMITPISFLFVQFVSTYPKRKTQNLPFLYINSLMIQYQTIVVLDTGFLFPVHKITYDSSINTDLLQTTK